ncbi:MAG: pitrilysin family protein [Parvibaculum sp.]|uniref:M16 family metallopeptidase n=1 Tax=Parvibaculum sp. TaxID=2024848 RepID=UPI003C731435
MMRKALLPVAAFWLVLVAWALPAEAMKIERVVSPGGIEAWLVEEYEVPVIVMNVSWRGGSAYDPKDKEGLANFVSGLLDEGAGDLTSEAFQKRLQDTGATMSFSEDRDYFEGRFKTLAERRDEAFGLFGLAVTRPRFDTDAVERIRAQIATIIARNAEDPEWIAARNFYKAAFGDHPYARPGDGTAKSIARIGREDLQAYAKNVFARDNMKIGVVGPIKPAELGALLDKTFGALPAKSHLPKMPEVKVASKASTVIDKRPFPQSVVIFGEEGLKRADPDFIPAYVANYVLGGGSFSSRLMEEVRVKRGLAYSVSSFLYPMRHGALFLGQLGTKNATTGVALSLVRAELARMAEGGLTDQELADAKTYLTGSYPLRFDSNTEIAGELLGIQQEDLGIDYVDRRNGLIEAVTKEDIARVAKRLFRSDRLIVSIVGEPDMSETPAPGSAERPMPAEPTGPHEAAPGG